MAADPIPIRPVLVTAEMEARRARQKDRGERAREREYDSFVAEANACNGECSKAPGSTRGGVLLGDGTRTAGMVAVDERGEPVVSLPVDIPWSLLGHSMRPCFDCNLARWEAWQDGGMSRKTRVKVENAEDRQLADQGRRKTREETFR